MLHTRTNIQGLHSTKKEGCNQHVPLVRDFQENEHTERSHIQGSDELGHPEEALRANLVGKDAAEQSKMAGTAIQAVMYPTNLVSASAKSYISQPRENSTSIWYPVTDARSPSR